MTTIRPFKFDDLLYLNSLTMAKDNPDAPPVYHILIYPNHCNVAEALCGQVIGYVISNPKNEHIIIQDLAVTPEFRNRGTGSALISKIENHKSNRIRHLKLFVKIRNKRAISFFLKRNYKLHKKVMAVNDMVDGFVLKKLCIGNVNAIENVPLAHPEGKLKGILVHRKQMFNNYLSE